MFETKEDLQRFYEELINHFGADVQMTIAVEEMSELQKEICKCKRSSGDVHHIAEEIADVEIMLEQLKIMFMCESEVALLKEQKRYRTYERYLKNGKVHEQRIGSDEISMS